MQAHSNAGQLFRIVDDDGVPSGCLKLVVDGAQADRDAQQITHEFDNTAIGAVADQRQRDDHLA